MTKGSLAAAARIYLSEHDPCDARASPLYADLAGLPPVRIHEATRRSCYIRLPGKSSWLL